MLAAWLGPTPIATFRATHLGRRPLAHAGTTAAAGAVLDWDAVGRILASPSRRADLLVVARGRLLDVPAPRSLAALRALMRDGIGIVLRGVERDDPGLARIAAAFGRELGRTVVQVFVTPAGTHGFGWHYDDEDVFIAQTAGIKDYRFRANTVAAATPAAASAFARFAEETSPQMTATLGAGDFLYLPARWWHAAHCHAEALSISVGVLPRRGRSASGTARRDA
jgi:50S ribosomal protein L16 3-hydroxylase